MQFVVALNPAPCGRCFYCERDQENLCEDLLFNNGAYAEYIRVPVRIVEKNMLRVPASMSFEAAALTDNATLRTFLQARGKAFLSNDYYDSDVAWMDLDAPIDITIGPYETYNDELFGYKASFEAYVTLRDDADCSSGDEACCACAAPTKTNKRHSVTVSKIGRP